MSGAVPVAVIMGSQSDWPTMRHAVAVLRELDIACDTRIVSAHRTPERLVAFAGGAAGEGFRVVIAGAGGAAHLPGMVAAMTDLPVLGVPVESRALSGLDSLLSIVQMPAGIPVGTLAITEVTGHRGRLVDVIGQTVPVTLFGHDTEAIPLPHPSGASTWFKTEPGAALTARALNLLARHPAMRDALA